MTQKYLIFLADMKSMGIPKPVAEYRFAPPRRWRFDFAWPDIEPKLALEIEGAVWTNGRHTRGSGFVKDMEKYNTATIRGWLILRVTPQEVNSGEAARLIRSCFSERINLC